MAKEAKETKKVTKVTKDAKKKNIKTKEISEIIDNNQRTVYNIINRIRKKVSSIVSNKNNY